MADFELDEESVNRADQLSSRLMSDLRVVSEKGPPFQMRRKIFSERRYAQQAEGTPINDVVTNVGRMAIEFAMARRWDNKILCLKLEEELAPLSMVEFFGGTWSPFGSEEWHEVWEREFPFPFRPHRLWREVLRRSKLLEEPVAVLDVNEAEQIAGQGLKGFLSYRFAGIKKWAEWIRGGGNERFPSSTPPPGGTGAVGGEPPPPAIGPGGSLQVQVSCLTPGLRIHVSPAYFISWVYFGSPTTPVAGYVLPGRYVFAGDGPMLPKRTRDSGVFPIPPTYHPSLTRF